MINKSISFGSNMFARRFIIIIMTILMLLGLYILMYIFLPNNRDELRHTSMDGGNINTINDGENTKNIDITKKKVVIDSGHGGVDSGKKSSSGILEKEINLIIAKKLQKKLTDNGINVVMTREDDNGLYGENDSNKKIADMRKRCEIVNNSGADIMVSIHQNSFQSPEVRGAQVFYYKHSAEGKKLAGILQKTFIEQVDNTNKRVEKADTTYYMFTHTKIPGVICECGFLSNPDEIELLSSDEYQEKIADALCDGIIKYFTES